MSNAELEFEEMGLLRMAEVPPAYKWLSDNDKFFLVHLLLFGAQGLPKKEVAKLDKKVPDTSNRLFANSLVDWLTDATGRPAALVLSWKGEEVAKVLLSVAKSQAKPRSAGGTARG